MFVILFKSVVYLRGVFGFLKAVLIFLPEIELD